MDITWLVSLIGPSLPFLMGLGQKALEKGAEKLGEKGAEGLLPEVQEVWNKLSPQVQAKPAAQEAAEDVAKNPDDADALAGLRNQLKKILEAPENTTLAAEITEILENAKAKSVETGKFNIDAQGSNIGIIGDKAKIDTMNFGTTSGSGS
jgi:hypothetical protein